MECHAVSKKSDTPKFNARTTTLFHYYLKGWEDVSQRFINEHINTMLQKLQDVINSSGEIVGY